MILENILSVTSELKISPNGLEPHGVCLLQSPDLICILLFCDFIIFLSYIWIAINLWNLRKIIYGEIRKKLCFLFSLFIGACGLTHLLDVVVMFFAVYYVQAMVLTFTAVISAWTAIILAISYGPIKKIIGHQNG